MSDVESVTLTFFAPVPRGHELHYATFHLGESGVKVAFVHDVTAGVLYASDRLAGPLGSHAAVQDPLGVLSKFSWILDHQDRGRSLGSMCSAEGDQTRTRLFFTREVAGYR
ncbi:MAG: hypothetical protein J0L92_04405 [Deltaproteobacteria bacterium]|nr:hypothetical protein [Deltaproteobacteria bacterium]